MREKHFITLTGVTGAASEPCRSSLYKRWKKRQRIREHAVQVFVHTYVDYSVTPLVLYCRTQSSVLWSYSASDESRVTLRLSFSVSAGSRAPPSARTCDRHAASSADGSSFVVWVVWTREFSTCKIHRSTDFATFIFLFFYNFTALWKPINTVW